MAKSIPGREGNGVTRKLSDIQCDLLRPSIDESSVCPPQAGKREGEVTRCRKRYGPSILSVVATCPTTANVSKLEVADSRCYEQRISCVPWPRPETGVHNVDMAANIALHISGGM